MNTKFEAWYENFNNCDDKLSAEFGFMAGVESMQAEITALTQEKDAEIARLREFIEHPPEKQNGGLGEAVKKARGGDAPPVQMRGYA